MRKTNLIKLLSILLIGVMVITFSTSVMAAENNNGIDLTETLNGNKNNNNSNTNVNNSNVNNNNANSNANNSNVNANNSNVNNSKKNNNANNNNSSVYNNTNLPKTGIGDSVPVAMLVVIFGISAVYAYKKVKEYKNV